MWTASIRDHSERIENKLAILKGGLITDESFHNHDTWECTIVIGGTSEHHVEDKVYSTKLGEVYTIIPNFAHKNINVKNFQHYNILFDLNYYLANYPQLKDVPGFSEFFITEPYQKYRHKFVSHLSLSNEQLAYVSQLCDDLCTITKEKKAGYKIVADICFVHLLTYISGIYIPSKEQVAKQFHNLEHTIDYIETHYHTNIRISELANMAFLSERQYTRLFQKLYKNTPMQYIINCRLSHAIHLIQTTSFSISQIAEECGFTDKSAFHHAFKKVYLQTPGEYRKSCLEKK